MGRHLATAVAAVAGLLAAPGVAAAAPSFAPLDADATATAPTDVALADVDGDGDLDAVVVTSGQSPAWAGTLDVLRNDGTGALAVDAAAHVALDGEARRIVVTDITADGLPDALVALGTDADPGTGANNDGQVRILRGTALGRFATATAIVLELGPGARATDLVLGELGSSSPSCDALPDVLVANPNGNRPSLFVSSGAGTFVGGSADPMGVSASADAVALADLDGDGKLDAPTSDAGDGSVVPLRGTCAITASPTTPSHLCRNTCGGAGFADIAANQPGPLIAFDQEGDDDADLLVTSTATSAPRRALLVRTTRAGGAYAPDTVEGPDLGFAQRRVTASDLDADGVADLLWAGSSGVHVARGAGTAAGWPFDVPLPLAGPGGSAVDAVAVATGDLDRDGRRDLVAIDAAGARLVAWRNTTRLPDPVVTTGAASVVGTTTATLNGRVDPRGLRVAYRFEYGATTAYGQATAAVVLPAGAAAADVLASVTGLAPGTVVHARLVGTSQDGVETVGGDVTFTTQVPPPPPPPPTPVASLTARLQSTLRYRESRLTGQLTVTGTLADAADGAVTATLRRAGASRALRTATGSTSAGAVRLVLRLPATQAPGTFTVAVAAPGPTSASLRHVLPAPPEGIVREAAIASFRGGPAVTTLGGTRRALWATFRFALKPARGALTIAWTRNGKAVGTPVARPRTNVVQASLAAAVPLARGRYEAVLRAGPTVVFRARVVLR